MRPNAALLIMITAVVLPLGTNTYTQAAASRGTAALTADGTMPPPPPIVIWQASRQRLA